MTKVTLTSEQIENWRQVLLPLFGPYALIMPTEMIQECRDARTELFERIAKLQR